jgi:hypothetical protein
MSAPLTRQYDLRVGKGEWGPTLPHTSAAYAVPTLSTGTTNYNYFQSQFLGMGVMFSRGGFITPVSQASPSEKTLWAVPLYQYKAVRHQPGASYDDIRLKLDALPQWSPPGVQFKLRWGVTYTLTYDKHNVQAAVSAGVGEELVHIRADLHVAPGEYPEAPDSPPPLWPHNGDPVNFYGTSTRLAAMSDILRCI